MIEPVHSVSTHGLATTHQDIPKWRDQLSQRVIHVGIWHHWKHGPQGLSVVIATWTAYPRSKRRFPMAWKRILGSTMQHWQTYGMSSLRRTINNVKMMQWSGTPNHYLMMCNRSMHFDWLSCSCSQLKCRLSKTIPMEVMDFLKFINHWTGTVFIAFAAYTNVDGEQTYARYKYNGNGHIPVLIHY